MCREKLESPCITCTAGAAAAGSSAVECDGVQGIAVDVATCHAPLAQSLLLWLYLGI